MTRRRLAVSWVVFLCCVSIALLASARSGWNPSGRGSNLETLLGRYDCTADPAAEDGWEGISLDASGDVLLDDALLIVWSSHSELPPDEHCAARVSQMLQLAERSGCNTSEIRITDVLNTHFEFVCTADRTSVVQAIARIARGFYQAGE